MARVRRSHGVLIVIGGREERSGEMKILREVATWVGRGKLCIATVASKNARDALFREYRKAFTSLGIKKITHLRVIRRDRAIDEDALKAVRGAAGVFFTGGDQLKITSELGGTLVSDEIERIFLRGGVIAGTSAGASVMSETMLIAGAGEGSYRIGGKLRMAPGLGFLKGIVVDQHFAERGRIGRLIAAVAHNPKFLGVGIDENTCIVADNEGYLRVLGRGGVYVLDAHKAIGNNISEGRQDHALSISNVRLHLLCDGDVFDAVERKVVSEVLKKKKISSLVHCEPQAIGSQKNKGCPK